MINFSRSQSTVEIARQANIQKEIEKLQTQVSTGKRIQAPSDDPLGNARLSQIRRAQGNEDAYAANALTASTLATRVDSAFKSVSDVMTRATELAVLAANDTYSPDQRKAVALEMRELAATITQISQQKDPRGLELFPSGETVAFAIGDGVTASGTVSRDTAFGSVVTAGGTKSVVTILEEAALAAETGTNADWAASLAAVNAASDSVTTQQSLFGLSARRIDDAAELLQNNKLMMTDERGTIEATDIAEATTLIKSNLTSLEAAQAIFARVNQKTLFDVLR
jgi:flagellar hook-associated protein 3 FlgL